MALSGSAAAYAELRSKHNRLIEVLGVTVNYKDELADKIADLTTALKEAEAERDAARNEHSSSNESVAQKDARIRFLEDHANESLRTIQDLRGQLSRDGAAQAATHAALKQTAAGLRTQLNALRDEVRSAGTRRGDEIAEVIKRMGVLHKAASRRKPKTDASSAAQATAAAAAAAAAASKVQVLGEALEECESKVKALEGKLGGQRKRIRELEFRLTEQADGFAAKLSFSKVENSELLSQLATARTSLKAAETTIADLREQLAQRDSNHNSSASPFKQFLDVKAQNQKLLEQLKRLRAKASRK